MRGRRRRKRSVSSTHRIKNYSPVSQQGLECDSHFSDAEERQQLHQHSARWAEVPPGVWAVMRLSPPSIPSFRDLMSQVWPLLLPGVLQPSGWWRRRAAADKICSDVFLTFVPLTSGIRLSCVWSRASLFCLSHTAISSSKDWCVLLLCVFTMRAGFTCHSRGGGGEGGTWWSWFPSHLHKSFKDQIQIFRIALASTFTCLAI